MYFSGQHGVMEISTASGTPVKVGRLKNWSYSTQQQTLDTTSLQDTDATLLNGLRTASGQASLLYYSETVSNVERVGGPLIKTGNNSFDSDSYGANAQPELCKIRLAVDGGGAIGIYAYVTSFSMTCSVGEVVSADVSFQVHGAPFEWSF
jgi:hypothetical protein